ncbi:MAG: 4-hydroxy-tetrahydrodipicolinate synthase [Acidimicrobiales bacterium]
MARFGPVITAMVTAFDASGALDLDATCRLANHLAANGSDALVLTGTTGEASVLTDEEQVAVWHAVRGAVELPLIAGSGTNDTAHAAGLTAQAAAAGMDAVLLVTPYYNRPGQAGIEAHFRAVAAATELPVLLYDIPVRTGRKIEHETILRLVDEVPNIFGVKDASGNPAASAQLIADAPDGFELYSGDDPLNLPLAAVGSVGTISVASHWAGLELSDLYDAFFSGDVARAVAINARLLASYAYETGDDAPNPIPTKVMLDVMGLGVGQCRLPMGPPPDGLADRARAVLAGLGRG